MPSERPDSPCIPDVVCRPIHEPERYHSERVNINRTISKPVNARAGNAKASNRYQRFDFEPPPVGPVRRRAQAKFQSARFAFTMVQLRWRW